MQRWWFALLLSLLACNAVFDNDPVKATDLRLLKPPSNVTASCPAAPDFSTWTIARREYAGVAGFSIHPTFLTAQHIAFGSQEAFYEGDLDAAPVPIVGLDDMTGAHLANPSAAPGGDMFWYTRYANLGGGLYYALRDGDHWAPHGADFPIVAYSLEPGTAAFYGSEVRMVVAVQPTMSSKFTLSELTSLDGAAWSNLGPLPFTTKGNYFDPALSVDGCILVYALEGVMYVALRGDDGTFGPPVLFPHTESYTNVVQPTLSPDASLVWFASDDGLFQATP